MLGCPLVDFSERIRVEVLLEWGLAERRATAENQHIVEHGARTLTAGRHHPRAIRVADDGVLAGVDEAVPQVADAFGLLHLRLVVFVRVKDRLGEGADDAVLVEVFDDRASACLRAGLEAEMPFEFGTLVGEQHLALVGHAGLHLGLVRVLERVHAAEFTVPFAAVHGLLHGGLLCGEVGFDVVALGLLVEAEHDVVLGFARPLLARVLAVALEGVRLVEVDATEAYRVGADVRVVLVDDHDVPFLLWAFPLCRPRADKKPIYTLFCTFPNQPVFLCFQGFSDFKRVSYPQYYQYGVQ